MKFLKTVIFAAMIATGFATSALADSINLDRLNTQVQSVSVQVASPNRRPMCSGTIVQSKKNDKGKVITAILTAEHCVTDSPYRDFHILVPVWSANSLRISDRDYFATVEKQGSDTNDLAILKLRDEDTVFPVATIGAKDTNLKFGEQVFASGYPFGRDLQVTEGRFSSRENFNFPDDSRDLDFFRASPAIAPGNSGGGLFHITSSGDFELIGVADWKMGRDQGTFGAYTPVDRVSDFVTSWSGFKK